MGDPTDTAAGGRRDDWTLGYYRLGVRVRRGCSRLCRYPFLEVLMHRPTHDKPATLFWAGSRGENGVAIVTAHRADSTVLLDMRTDLLREELQIEPDWGPDSSLISRSRLAVAIIADFCDDDNLALRYYKRFQSAFIHNLSNDKWIIHASVVLHWIMRGAL